MYLKVKKGKGNTFGVTIIELMVAISMSALVIGIITATWIGFSKHVIGQRRKSILRAELRQVLEGITSQLRRSPAVLAWHSSGITYVSPNNGDTIVYEYYYDELLKDDIPITIISQSAYITDFVIDGSAPGDEESDLTLLAIYITMADDFGNQSSASSQVAAKVIKESEYEQEDELSGWNF